MKRLSLFRKVIFSVILQYFEFYRIDTWLRTGVLNSNVFKGHILKKYGLAGRAKPRFTFCGSHFCVNQTKSYLIWDICSFMKVVGGRTDHVGGPHAVREMSVWDPWSRVREPSAGLGQGMLRWSGKVGLGKFKSSWQCKYCNNVLFPGTA